MAKSHGGASQVDYAIGAEVIHDTAVHTGKFHHIDFYENSTITAIVSTNIIDNSFAGATVDEGAHLSGYFTSIQLQNGACIAYKI
ncbi:MAG: hypothetical protein ACO3XZ_09350 [Ilumatobacteraceae bacterium]